jgi:hypothetical protein
MKVLLECGFARKNGFINVVSTMIMMVVSLMREHFIFQNGLLVRCQSLHTAHLETRKNMTRYALVNGSKSKTNEIWRCCEEDYDELVVLQGILCDFMTNGGATNNMQRGQLTKATKQANYR